MDTALNPDRPDRLATDVAALWTTVQEQQQLLAAQSREIATLQRRRRWWSLPALPGLRVSALVAALLLTLQPGVLLAAAADTWTSVASMSTARDALAAATGADGTIYAIGGHNNGALPTVEAYTRDNASGNDTWAAVTSMGTARSGLAAATGADGRIYAIGGNNGGTLSTVEAYTPSTNTWATVTPAMPTPRTNLAAATGADGRIYAIGGDNTNSGGTLNTVEAYTPSTNTWATVASMNSPRQYPAAAMGADGRVYAIGGFNASGTFLNTVEAYTPLSAPTPGLGAVGQPGIAGYSSGASLLKSPVNAGVYGGSESGVGGWFHSTNGAPLHLDPGPTSGPPTAGTFQLGDLYLGSTGLLYLYNGTSWKTLGGGPTDARLTSVHAVAQGTSVRFSWRVADGEGIAGFAVYAQTHRLNRAMIAVHPARTYQYVGHWTGSGPYSLHVLLSTGRQLTVPMH